MTRYAFIIATAAITRPELHRVVLPEILRFIGRVPVKWLINIDPVPGRQDVEGTRQAYEAQLSGIANIDIEFVGAGDEGCFLVATKTLAERTTELLDECELGVLWLEDDWHIRELSAAERVLARVRSALSGLGKDVGHAPLHGDLASKTRQLRQQFSGRSADWYVALVPRTAVSFNPGIWSKQLFLTHVVEPLAALAADATDDPETLCADPVNQLQKASQPRLLVDPLFQDAGRFWGAEEGLVKWDKRREQLSARGKVSYADVRMPRGADEVVVEKPVGVVEFTNLFGRNYLSFLARIREVGGRSQLTFIGSPYPVFDLAYTGSSSAELYILKALPWARTFPFENTRVAVQWRRCELSNKMLLGVDSRVGTFETEMQEKMPLKALWLVPLQSVIGSVMYLREVYGTLLSFDRG